jgi:hypothetical protein
MSEGAGSVNPPSEVFLFLRANALSWLRARASDRAGVNAGGATEGLALTPARSGASSSEDDAYVRQLLPIKVLVT